MDQADKQDSALRNAQFEREKWQKDCEFRERDFVLRSREIAIQESELETKRNEQKRAIWTNPLVLALSAATVAAFANVFVALHNADAQRTLEQSQAEHARIVNAITGDANAALEKLRFLLNTHLIMDETTRHYILTYIDTQQVTNPPAVTTQTPPPPATSTVKRVAVESGWLDGGHNQAEVCGGFMNDLKAKNPGAAINLVNSSEDSHKDFLGHVTYKYHCAFDVG
ncbi:MAG: hypothetical protein PGN33_10290 [Methylobacterium radiotolerans]